VIEATWALQAIGPLADRIATMAVTVVVDGLAFGACALALGPILWRFRSPETEDPPVSPPAPLWICLSLVGLGLGVAVFGALNRGEKPTYRPHVVLISIDTLRADHLSSYGYERETSPRLDALARKGVLFTDATSHSTWTLPSHVSMFTGLNPAAHGVLARDHRIQPFHHTLAERLREAGYATSAWVGTRHWGFVGADYGFAAGFDRFLHAPHPRRFRSARLLRAFDAWWLQGVARGVGNAHDQVTAAIQWIDVEREEPFFAFLHFYDVHSKEARLPYEAPEPFREMFCEGDVDEVDLCDEGVCASERLLEIANGRKAHLDAREIEWARCLYDGGIAFVDREVGRLLDALEDRGLLEETVVIVTSDHGEAFFEHDYPLHSTLHHEITRIPLIVRAPDALAGKRATGIVRQIDLLPTILDYVGLPVGDDVQGRSLRPLLTDWHAMSDAEALAFDDGFGGVLLRSGSQALIRHPDARTLAGQPARELYDLATDPLQVHDQARSQQSAVAKLELRMAELMRESDALRQRQAEGQRRVDVEISEEAAAGLRALGYVIDEPGEAAGGSAETGR